MSAGKPEPPINPYCKPPVKMADYVSSLPEGVLTLQVPWNLSPESVDDVEYLFILVVRQLRRNAIAQSPEVKP